MNASAARLGILMLDTQFPRILGDVGNAATWPFPVRYGVVEGATPWAVIVGDQERFFQAFVEKGHDLIAQGCTGIATTCGFLAPMRARLADALGVPVAASALEQAAMIATRLPAAKRLGVLTISAPSLTPAHLQAAGVPEGTPIRGLENSSFAASILGNATTLDVPAARAEMRAAAAALVADHPEVGAIILECTNMVPYADAVAEATGLPVYSIYTYLCWFHGGLVPPAFPDS